MPGTPTEVRCALAEASPPCPRSFRDTGKWTRIKAQDEGWFFSYKEKKAYCPDHVPEWVPAWREQQKKGRSGGS